MIFQSTAVALIAVSLSIMMSSLGIAHAQSNNQLTGEGMLAWTETDLFVVRNYVPSLANDMPPAARRLVFERPSTLVAVDRRNRWYVRYFDFGLNQLEGEDGDYQRFARVVQDRSFLSFRCLRFNELQITFNQQDCGWATLRELSDGAFRDPAAQAAFLEAVGTAVGRIADARRRSLLEDDRIGDWLSQAVVLARELEVDRASSVSRLDVAQAATESEIVALGRQLGALARAGHELQLVFEPLPSDSRVFQLDLGDSVVYVSAGTHGDDERNYLMSGAPLSLEKIHQLQREGEIAMGVATRGDAEVRAVDLAALIEAHELNRREF